LHKRRRVGHLHQRASDLEIEDLIDLDFSLGGDMRFYGFAKVLQ
jgi:hypothetical protein